jgi:hypothetical protein
LKPFTKAVQALEDLGSKMTEMRSRMHYEIAVCEIEVEDVLAKANLHIDKAIALNTSEEFHKLYLEPLKRRITVKMNLYDEPDRIEEQVLQFLERAKEAEGVVQESLLSSAFHTLTTMKEHTKER